MTNKGSNSAQHTLINTMHHGDTDRHCLPTLLPYLYHDNRGRLSAPTTHCYMYLHILCRGKHFFQDILKPNMYNDNRLAGTMLTTL